MKIWKFVIVAVAAIMVGVGAGYYVFDNSYAKKNSIKHEALMENISKTPVQTPTAQIYSLPLPEREASVSGETITNDDYIAHEEKYMLKEYLGRIAVHKIYTSGQMTLVNIVDVSTDALPESDRKLLENGIEGLSYEEMLQLLEDYTS